MNTQTAWMQPIFASLICLACALASPSAHAADKPATAASAAQQAQPKKPVKVKVDEGSGETRAQRDARLKRECKGRPNAGACLGYAS